jgi:catechol 2,3-dioxygenase
MSTPEKKGVQAIDPRVRMGHVHLKVADLERALGFYRDVLGFETHAARFGAPDNPSLYPHASFIV